MDLPALRGRHDCCFSGEDIKAGILNVMAMSSRHISNSSSYVLYTKPHGLALMLQGMDSGVQRNKSTTLDNSFPCLSAASVAKWKGGKDNVRVTCHIGTSGENAVIITVTTIMNTLRCDCSL